MRDRVLPIAQNYARLRSGFVMFCHAFFSALRRVERAADSAFLGHLTDDLLLDHYLRAVARKTAAEFWKDMPPKAPKKVVRMKAAVSPSFGRSVPSSEAQHLHRAIALRIESAKAEVLAQRIVGNERVERSPLPNNFLARGGENLGERGGFFIVERHALA